VSGGKLPAEALDLRAVAQRFTNRKNGSLDDFVARHFLKGVHHDAADRASRRLDALCTMATHWRHLLLAAKLRA
jgi:hypothetical protein